MWPGISAYLRNYDLPQRQPDPTPYQLMKSQSATSLVLPDKPDIKKHHMDRCRAVLNFSCYFKEHVNDTPLEHYRIRKCVLRVYMQDETMEIFENKYENAGYPQGKFVIRHNIPKDDTFYTIDDINVGGEISIYGRTFYIIGASSSTRRFMDEVIGRQQEPNMDYPMDTYEEYRRERMSRETGCDPTVKHNITKNPSTQFHEARLGKTVDNSHLAGYLKYGQQVLRFYCMWDDRRKMYGDVHNFRLHYYLADDTCEVLTVHNPNGGRDPFPLLLKRTTLPKSNGTGKLHWTDLSIGEEITIYSRTLKIMDADPYTRDFYEKKGISLGDKIVLPRKPIPIYKREIPPYTGFGSEEDSLNSCVGSILPTAPVKKIGDPMVLKFRAIFSQMNTAAKPYQMDREFCISLYCEDCSISIYEIPRRNSGYIGGKFLSRTKITDSEGCSIITKSDFFVGAELNLNGYCFLLIDAEDNTYRYMSKDPQTFPHSDIITVMEKLKGFYHEAAKSGALTAEFKKSDPENTSKLDLEQFYNALVTIEPKAIRTYTTEGEGFRQACITAWKHYQSDGIKLIDYLKFVEYVESEERVALY